MTSTMKTFNGGSNARSEMGRCNHSSPEFVGRGWCFPPKFITESCDAHMISGDANIQDCLRVLFATRPGERVMRPSYGCDLYKLVFAKIDTTTITEAKECVKRAILYYEPRITLLEVSVLAQENGLIITVEYVIRTTNTRSNIVYPFYFLEGTHVLK